MKEAQADINSKTNDIKYRSLTLNYKFYTERRKGTDYSESSGFIGPSSVSSSKGPTPGGLNKPHRSVM